MKNEIYHDISLISKHGNVIVTLIGSLWTHDTMSWLKATEKDAKITKKEQIWKEFRKDSERTEDMDRARDADRCVERAAQMQSRTHESTRQMHQSSAQILISYSLVTHQLLIFRRQSRFHFQPSRVPKCLAYMLHWHQGPTTQVAATGKTLLDRHFLNIYIYRQIDSRALSLNSTGSLFQSTLAFFFPNPHSDQF